MGLGILDGYPVDESDVVETPGGSGTWLMTMATELIRKGHNVHVYLPGSYKLILGQTSRQLGVKDGNEYDLGLVNHIPVVWLTSLPHARR